MTKALLLLIGSLFCFGFTTAAFGGLTIRRARISCLAPQLGYCQVGGAAGSGGPSRQVQLSLKLIYCATLVPRPDAVRKTTPTASRKRWVLGLTGYNTEPKIWDNFNGGAG